MDRILVTRATGRLGREVVPRLLDRGVEVKAGTHEPDRAARLFDTAVEVVELDYLRTETYDAAVMWADRILLTPPPFDPRTDEHLIPFLDWAVSSGTGHVVLLSAMGIDEFEHVPLHRVEERVRETGVPFTFLRPNWYMQNFLSDFLAAPIRERGEFALPVDDGVVSMVDVRDVADAAVLVLTGDDRIGAALTLTGPAALTHDEVARAISRTTGTEVRYRAVAPDVMRQNLEQRGWRADQVEVALGLFRAMRENRRASVTDDLASLLERGPRSFEAFVEEHAAVWRPGAAVPP